VLHPRYKKEVISLQLDGFESEEIKNFSWAFSGPGELEKKTI